jgi:hypothetical protein
MAAIIPVRWLTYRTQMSCTPQHKAATSPRPSEMIIYQA